MIDKLRLSILLASIMPGILFLLYRNTCLLKHRKKTYVACDLAGRHNAQNIYVSSCSCVFNVAKHHYMTRWVCEACGNQGEHCIRKWGEWKVEGGVIVPDVKKLSNWEGS